LPLPAPCLPPTHTSAPAVHAPPAPGAAPGPAGAARPGGPARARPGQPPPGAPPRPPAGAVRSGPPPPSGKRAAVAAARRRVPHSAVLRAAPAGRPRRAGGAARAGGTAGRRWGGAAGEAARKCRLNFLSAIRLAVGHYRRGARFLDPVPRHQPGRQCRSRGAQRSLRRAQSVGVHADDGADSHRGRNGFADQSHCDILRSQLERRASMPLHFIQTTCFPLRPGTGLTRLLDGYLKTGHEPTLRRKLESILYGSIATGRSWVGVVVPAPT